MGLMSHLAERLKAIPSEINQTFWDKAGPQGAAELSQALNSHSNAYVPYGTAQQPLEVEGPQTSYQETLRDASQRGGHEPEHEIER